MRRISSGTVTVCVMAIVVGLVAAFVVKQVMAPKPQPVVEAPKEPTIPVVVAIKNLPENHVVRPGDVRVVQIPVSRKPKEATLRLAAIAENRIVKEAVKAGQTMRDDMLYAIGETLPGLESRIPAGMRALPIHVDEQSVVAKMVNLNSRVDVALTVEGTHPDLGEMATKTLLHNVEVIGVDRTSATRRA
ncbi:MAG TPA: Flp pilus assembly protein CpaB, partial [Pirellulaceae bacterium]|nr:Flp pilus assembly protein CpaB [Pirellulaceae bacterium]